MRIDIVDTVHRFLNDARCRQSRVIVAVSGGVDSAVLLKIMHTVATDTELKLVVAHANHGLRETHANEDEIFVRDLAAALELDFVSERLDVSEFAKTSGRGIEASAREMRYDFLIRCAENFNADFVVVGHTADDVAETVIMNLARGSGIDGLSSHVPSRNLTPTLLLLRPLLSVLRSDVLEFAHQNGMTWREDQSNDDLKFLRNSVRSIIMPQMREVFGDDVGLRMAESSVYLGQAKHMLQDVAQPYYDRCIERVQGEVHVLIDPLLASGTYMMTNILRTAVRTATSRVPTASETARLQKLVWTNPGAKETLSGSYVAIRERDCIVIHESQSDLRSDVVINGDGLYVANELRLSKITSDSLSAIFDSDPLHASIDADIVRGQLVWRTWIDGDRFVPFGMTERVLISDLLTNAKVDVSKKREVRVISDDVGILWVCGYRQAERTRITGTTATVITFCLSLQ